MVEVHVPFKMRVPEDMHIRLELLFDALADVVAPDDACQIGVKQEALLW
jgi:hypothetical protein